MATSSAKVLVTGATGYVGGHVVKALQEAGHKVRGTVRSVKNTDKVKHLYNLCPQAAHPLELVEADLNVPESWLSAVAGMDYVMHVASPVSIAAPKNEDEVIRPALDGTLSVLRACAKETSIRRVVITSSIVAVFDSRQNSDRPLTEDDWADVSSATSYSKSKIMAEKAAWDFVKTLDGDARFELAVINPGYILGPPLNATQSSSFEILPQLLERKMRMVPHVNVPIIDVRDLALAHLAAMTSREAAGHRHICTGHNLWIPDMAAILKCVFGPQGYNVPTSLAPKPLLWVASLFSGQVKTLMSLLDKVNTYDNTRMRKVLKVEPRDVQDTLVEMAYTLIEKGIVKRTPEYRGPGGPEEKKMYMKVRIS